MLTGSSGTTSTHSGHAKPGKRLFACLLRSAAKSWWRPFQVAACWGWRVTNAIGRSPHLMCCLATTLTSRTWGWLASSCSMARLDAFWDRRLVRYRFLIQEERGRFTSPPEMMISLLLSFKEMEPSGFITAKSPVWKLPPLNAFFVASGSLKYFVAHQKGGKK